LLSYKNAEYGVQACFRANLALELSCLDCWGHRDFEVSLWDILYGGLHKSCHQLVATWVRSV